ncbi:MAG: hypothetical protein WDO19_14180 [Bacteroidota bacterium]
MIHELIELIKKKGPKAIAIPGICATKLMLCRYPGDLENNSPGNDLFIGGINIYRIKSAG